jgi:hypothetical protein
MALQYLLCKILIYQALSPFQSNFPEFLLVKSTNDIACKSYQQRALARFIVN